MNEIKSCVYNDVNLTVNVVYADNRKISILVTPIENSLDLSLAMQSKFDWLLYNDPSTFAELVLSDRLQAFLEDYGKSYQQENNISKQLEDKFSPETAREIEKKFCCMKANR